MTIRVNESCVAVLVFGSEVDKAKIEFLDHSDLRGAMLAFAKELVFRQVKEFKVLVVIIFRIFAFLKAMN